MSSLTSAMLIQVRNNIAGRKCAVYLCNELGCLTFYDKQARAELQQLLRDEHITTDGTWCDTRSEQMPSGHFRENHRMSRLEFLNRAIKRLQGEGR